MERGLRDKVRHPLRLLGPAAQSALAIVVTFIMLFPIIWLYSAAFKPTPDIFGDPFRILPRRVTLQHFVDIWNAVGFQIAFRNSVIVASVSAAISTSIAFMAAFSLSRFRYRLRGTFSMLMLATQMLPGIVIVVPLIITLRRVHLTNSLVGLTITYLLLGLPIATWMLKGYLDDIPRDIDEAALIDGSNYLGVLRHILFPLLAPAIVAVGAFAFVLAWGEYLFALSLITSVSVKTLPLALQAAFAQYTVDWGMLAAGGVIISLPVAIVFMLFQRYLVGGLTAGGVKG